MDEWHCVTGAFGYSGRVLARALRAAGHRVRTLTNAPRPSDPRFDAIDVHPLAFDDPERLRRSLEGVDVLYNTYWVRFSKAGFSQARAVANTRVLFAAARDAGVRRIVHTSITNPSLDSPYEYFRGKAELEEALAATGLSFAILRPAVFFGGHDILVNNIAWMLRHLPVFGCFGDGAYRLRPIHVKDFARLALEAGRDREDRVVDAVGPETWTYRALAQMLGEAIGHPRKIVSVPRTLGLWTAKLLGLGHRDVVLTGDEIDALMDGLLATDGPPTGSVRLSIWAREHADTLGRTYAHELARRRHEPRA